MDGSNTACRALPWRLGRVHRGVGVGEQVVGSHVVAGHRDPDAHAG